MKKSMNFSLFCTLCLVISSVILSGCRKDEPEEPTKVQTYYVSIQAGKGDAHQANGVKRVLGLDGNTLNATWKTGDRVTAYNLTEKVDLSGYLEAESDGALVMISGTLSGKLHVGDQLQLKYLSPDNKLQDGTLEYISNICDYAVATIHVASISGSSIEFEEGIADFKNQQAIVKFTLKDENDADLNCTTLFVDANGSHYRIDPTSPTNEVFVAIDGFDGKTIRLVVPYGEDDAYIYTSPSPKTLENGKYYNITVRMKLKEKLPGFFIDEDTRVEFSKGNLQYKASESKWRIAENQYDFVGTYYMCHWYSGSLGWLGGPAIGNVYEQGVKCDNTNESIGDVMSTNCWIDQFGWNTADNPLLLSDNPDDYYIPGQTFKDWGQNIIHDTKSGTEYPSGYWRTLSIDEWMYILSGRANAENLCGLASIDDPTYGNVKGLILLPENFENPGVTFYSISNRASKLPMTYKDGEYFGPKGAPNYIPNVPGESDAVNVALLTSILEDEKYMFNVNRYTHTQWEQLENAGAVFLPACGWIQVRYVTDRDHPEDGVWALPKQHNFIGAYWSSSYHGSYDASYLLMTYEVPEVGHATQPFMNGQSVRLVRNITE